MKDKVIDTLNHCTDVLPVGGGIIGANMSAAADTLPFFGSLIFVIVVSVVGAITGYMVKMFLDYLFRKYKN